MKRNGNNRQAILRCHKRLNTKASRPSSQQYPRGADRNFGNLAKLNLRYVGAFGVAIGVVAAFAGSASAAIVDGFEVTFNALPTMALSQDLPNSLSINDTNYTPANLVYPVPGGIGGFSHQSSNPWRATNPFQYSPSLNGSVYDAIWNGAASYSFNAPQWSFSILGGTIDASNAVRFYGTNGAVIGTIYGADLAPAAAANFPGYQWANGVNITVELAATPCSSASVIGGPDLTFEYANIVTAVLPPIHLGIERDGSGGLFIRYPGVPDVTYRLQRAASVTGAWSDLATNTAPASGLIEYHETSPPPGQSFYRTVQP